MPTCVADCPRCGANSITFDTQSFVYVEMVYNWKRIYEVFSVCRSCHKPTVFKMHQNQSGREMDRLFDDSNSPSFMSQDVSLNDIFYVDSYVSLRDKAGINCPEHTPEYLKVVFDEAAACYSISCYNASVSMLRLCLDLDTKQIAEQHGIKGLLYARLTQIFKLGLLNPDLEELSHCIRENGNDGAHDGSITKIEAEDIMDFTISYLESRYTMPQRIKLRKQARNKRQ